MNVEEIHQVLQEKGFQYRTNTVMEEVQYLLHTMELEAVEVHIGMGKVKLSKNMNQGKIEINTEDPEFIEIQKERTTEYNDFMGSFAQEYQEISNLSIDISKWISTNKQDFKGIPWDKVYKQFEVRFKSLPQIIKTNKYIFSCSNIMKNIENSYREYSGFHRNSIFRIYETSNEVEQYRYWRDTINSLSEVIDGEKWRLETYQKPKQNKEIINKSHSDKAFIVKSTFCVSKLTKNVKNRESNQRITSIGPKTSLYMLVAGLKTLLTLAPEKYNLLKDAYNFYSTILILTLSNGDKINNNLIYKAS